VTARPNILARAGPPMRLHKGARIIPRAPGKRTSGQIARFTVSKEKARPASR
jgi:hypothetical protein